MMDTPFSKGMASSIFTSLGRVNTPEASSKPSARSSIRPSRRMTGILTLFTRSSFLSLL